MDTIHWASLLLASLFGALANLAAVLGPNRSGRGVADRWAVGWTKAVWPSVAVAGIALLVSALVHLAFGHTPGSPRGLSTRDYAQDHGSFFVALMLPALALMLSARGNRPPADDTE